MDEQQPKRTKRDSSYKAKAFEKFKQLKSGTRSKYEVEEIENVYETVDEQEYVNQVLSRQEDDWIVNDDGSGYVEDGREIFDDDLDSESIAQAASKGKGVKRKKKAVSENAGKGNLQFMLSNMPAKKKEEKKLEDDTMLSELLDEMEGSGSTDSLIKPKPISKEVKFEKQIIKDYMKSLSKPLVQPRKTLTPTKKVLIETQNIEEQPCTSKEPSPKLAEPQEEELIEQNDPFEDDLDLSHVEPPEEPEEKEDLGDEIKEEFLNTWSTFTNDATIQENEDLVESFRKDKDEKVFRFYWWDAFENHEKKQGTVVLFGKTFCETTKKFVSCSVVVEDIFKKIYVLPRAFEMDDEGKDTTTPVTMENVYQEFKNVVMKPLNITTFKTRFVNKKYAFNAAIPAESDYMEVHFPAKYREVTMPCLTPRTFSAIFGQNSSCLEILLLDRKLKGPCWLEIRNFELASNPISWCNKEITCKITNITIAEEERPPPPLVVATLNMRTVKNVKKLTNDLVMISCLVQNFYSLDKEVPKNLFNSHFCVLCGPQDQPLPLDLHETLSTFKATKVQKLNSEQALINYFITQFFLIDPDLVVGHDLQGYQINVLAECLMRYKNKNFSKLGRLKRSQMQKLEKNLFLGRLVCDIKNSARELIKSRSYDLDALCQQVLKIKESQRIQIEPEEIRRMFLTTKDVIKLVSFTMQDAQFILKIMYELNIIPLALQITNIAGNLMVKTLLGGRSERNEFLLLHAFTEKNYIVPEKYFRKKLQQEDDLGMGKKKPSYAGGLVLEPKIGFYDKLIILMDFNSLYPSIIQEYNICFTTIPPNCSEDKIILPEANVPMGILPTEIRKLVESRREVKKLMKNPDLSNDLRKQYEIRQMALKLTANSMYGCLGFANSRFFAKNLAALITFKGREILTNTKDLVEKMNFEVVYGDTDSIMINTNSLDYEDVLKKGLKIKQEVNKLYKQVELDIDGVFKYLLLLKKKKYAAVSMHKNKKGELCLETEYKGLDLVRRDYSQLASEAGKFILEHILSDLSADDRINNIHNYLEKIRNDLQQNRVPIQLLIITKQLAKDPSHYSDVKALPHVQVALRYNKTCGGHLRNGDTVPYVICEDGTSSAHTQRAYHIDEFKNSKTLKIDLQYYLSQQIFPVISRLCEPIPGIDAYQIAASLGLDMQVSKKYNKEERDETENILDPLVKFRNAQKFVFDCPSCKQSNTIQSPLLATRLPFLLKCSNDNCSVRPLDYLPHLQNEVVLQIRHFIQKYYKNDFVCEDSACRNESKLMTLKFADSKPLCRACDGVLLKVYQEKDLYYQLSYFQYIFDLSKLEKKPKMDEQVESAFASLKQTVEQFLNSSKYSIVNVSELFSIFATV